MGARTKLNSAAIQGAIVVAGILGVVCGSWTVFWLATGVLVATSLHDGTIRIGGRRK